MRSAFRAGFRGLAHSVEREPPPLATGPPRGTSTTLGRHGQRSGDCPPPRVRPERRRVLCSPAEERAHRGGAVRPGLTRCLRGARRAPARRARRRRPLGRARRLHLGAGPARQAHHRHRHRPHRSRLTGRGRLLPRPGGRGLPGPDGWCVCFRRSSSLQCSPTTSSTGPSAPRSRSPWEPLRSASPSGLRARAGGERMPARTSTRRARTAQGLYLQVVPLAATLVQG